MFDLAEYANEFVEPFISKNKPITSMFTPSSGEVWLIYFECLDNNLRQSHAANQNIDHCLATFTPDLIKKIRCDGNYLLAIKRPTVITTDYSVDFASLALSHGANTVKPTMITFLKQTNVALVMYNVENHRIFVSMDIELKEFIVIGS